MSCAKGTRFSNEWTTIVAPEVQLRFLYYKCNHNDSLRKQWSKQNNIQNILLAINTTKSTSYYPVYQFQESRNHRKCLPFLSFPFSCLFFFSPCGRLWYENIKNEWGSKPPVCTYINHFARCSQSVLSWLSIFIRNKTITTRFPRCFVIYHCPLFYFTMYLKCLHRRSSYWAQHDRSS